MTKTLFYIQFRGQLRRTRPDLITSLEKTVTDSAYAAGGVMESGRKILAASFDEDRIGFPLNMVIFLEKVYGALEKASPELYGYALVLGRDLDETAVKQLCRSARDNGESTGLWCSALLREALEFYMEFDASAPEEKTAAASEYREVKKFKAARGNAKEDPYRAIIKNALAAEGGNILFLGANPAGLRDGIGRYRAALPGNAPPLIIRFGAGAPELACFADAFTPEIRSFLAASLPAGAAEELDAVHSRLFRERLRKEWPPGMREQARLFIASLLRAYDAAAKTRAENGTLVLEEPDAAGNAAGLFAEAYSALKGSGEESGTDSGAGSLVLGAGSLSEKEQNALRGIFSRVYTVEGETPANFEPADIIPKELWELSYNILLLERYFPAYLLPRLFEEEGLDRELYSRTLEIFQTPRLAARPVWSTETPGEFSPGISAFGSRAGEILGGRAEKIRAMVRGRLLSWVISGKLHACFNFCAVFAELGDRVSDALVLKSLRSDVFNGTCGEIEKAIEDGRFEAVTGNRNAPVFKNIYRNLKALVWGAKEEIRLAFAESALPAESTEDGKPCYAGCRAQAFTSLAAFCIGGRNIDGAADAIRGALLLNRGLGSDAVPAYRLFALVNIAKQRVDDAMEYISMALEQAGKSVQSEDTALTSYFASALNLLYGNLSKAKRLAFQAEETAFGLGRQDWGQRARFLRGRICFETGRYEDALECFESLAGKNGASGGYGASDGRGASGGRGALDLDEGDASGSGGASPGRDRRGRSALEMAETVQAWISRTKLFLGRRDDGRETRARAGFDAEIFRIEEAYFASDYQKAIALADDFLLFRGEEGEDDFFYTEQPDWKSGFSQCELMLQSGKVFAARLVRIYRAMARCALQPPRQAREEVLGEMQRFMREELLPDTDPKDAFCFHAWYRMLRDTKASELDMNTVVSMAYKRLQRRASRIDNSETRQAFLNLSRWNSELYLAARELKLV